MREQLLYEFHKDSCRFVWLGGRAVYMQMRGFAGHVPQAGNQTRLLTNALAFS